MNKQYSKDEILQIVKQYNLSQAEIMEVIDKIEEFLTINSTPQNNPIAVIAGGQPGAGKTGLISNSTNLLEDNCVIIDNDVFRLYHPKVAEINTKYPELFTECTDQLSFAATPILLDRMMQKHHNIVFHQTLKSNVVVDNAIAKLKNHLYTVIVRALAVSDLESYMSMIDRCQADLKIRKTCRWVPLENHDTAYYGMPNTISYIETPNTNRYDMLEIVMRGKENPTQPIVIYRKLNDSMSEASKQTLLESNFKTSSVGQDNYANAKEALLTGRESSNFETLQNIGKRLANAQNLATTTEEKIRIARLYEQLNSRLHLSSAYTSGIDLSNFKSLADAIKKHKENKEADNYATAKKFGDGE